MAHAAVIGYDDFIVHLLRTAVTKPAYMLWSRDALLTGMPHALWKAANRQQTVGTAMTTHPKREITPQGDRYQLADLVEFEDWENPGDVLGRLNTFLYRAKTPRRTVSWSFAPNRDHEMIAGRAISAAVFDLCHGVQLAQAVRPRCRRQGH